jgi:hypothetical protein
MALVSDSCVKAWFQTDSWVYKGFEYLFRNPLWRARTPVGFSLCPYFWLALFSILIFKPIIVPICLGFKWLIKKIIKLGGVPIRSLDEYFGRRWFKSLAYNTGKGIAILIGLIAAIAFVGICALGIYTYSSYLIHKGLHLFFLFVWTVTNVISVLVTSIYNYRHRYCLNRCKVEWYSVIIFIVSTLMYCVFFPDMGLIAVKAIGTGFIWVFKALWWLISGIFWVLGICLKYIAIALWWVIKVIALIIIAVVASLILLSPMGLLIWFIMKVSERKYHEKMDKMDKERKITSNDIYNLIYLCIRDCDYWLRKTQWRFSERDWEYAGNSTRSKRYQEFRKSMAQGVLYDMLFRVKIPYQFFDLKYSQFEAFKKSVKIKSDGFCCLTDAASSCKMSQLIPLFNKIEEKFLNILENGKVVERYAKVHFTTYQDTITDWNTENERLRKVRAEKEAKKEKAKEKANELCHSFSDPIAAFFTRIKKVIGRCLRFIFVTLIWKRLIVRGWRITCFICKQIKIFSVYMWHVIKERKQGACPYMLFTDPSENSKE